ncbi:Hypothetical protein FKW44_007969, partial [Caligus rogercresseyi]
QIFRHAFDILYTKSWPLFYKCTILAKDERVFNTYTIVEFREIKVGMSIVKTHSSKELIM